MDKIFERKYHYFEEDFWWTRGRRDVILRLIKKLGVSRNDKILDIGCTGGVLMDFLTKEGYKIVGLDISLDAVELCRKKGLNAVVEDASCTSFKKGEFDLIIASDVLEHIIDDRIAVSEWYRILKRGGMLILFVPAFKFLWSGHDEFLHHFRRYSKAELKSIAKGARFQIERTSYWDFFLFFPIVITRMIEKILRSESRGHDKEKWQEDTFFYKKHSILNKFLFYILKMENIFLSKFNLPFGISLLIVAKK